MPQLVHRLTGTGFHYRGDHGDAGGHYFVVDSFPDVRTNHLHVVEHANQWRDYLRLRDLLRHQPAIRRKYAELKRGLVSTCGNDGVYTASKADFIRQVLDRALISAGETKGEPSRRVAYAGLFSLTAKAQVEAVTHQGPSEFLVIDQGEKTS
jgi:hypothetical protein